MGLSTRAPQAPYGPEFVTYHLGGNPILLFDGICNLCSGFVDFILKRELDDSITFCPIQSPPGQAFLVFFGLPLTDWESNVFIENGQPYFKSEAFFRVMRYLRRPWPFLAAGRIAPCSFRDWVYDRVAQNRYAWFGTRKTCRVADDSLRSRFID